MDHRREDQHGFFNLLLGVVPFDLDARLVCLVSAHVHHVTSLGVSLLT